METLAEPGKDHPAEGGGRSAQADEGEPGQAMPLGAGRGVSLDDATTPAPAGGTASQGAASPVETRGAERITHDVKSAVDSGDTAPTPYYALYEVPFGTPAAETLKLSDFPGLRLLHRVRREAVPEQLVTYWRSRDEWEAENTRIGRAADGAGLVSHGFVRTPQVAANPWWKRIHLYTWILGIAAFLGALEAIGNHYDWLLEKPSLFLKVQNPESLGVLEEHDFLASIEISNQTHLEHKEVTVSVAELQPSGGGPRTTLKVDRKHLGALGPGSSVEIRVSGKAPAAGRYELHVAATGRAGKLAGSPPSPLTFPVRIWPANLAVERSLDSIRQGRISIGSTLTVGSAATLGVDCELIVNHHRIDRPLLNYPNSSGEQWSPDYTTPGQEKATFEWHGAALAARQDVAFTCSVPVPQGTDVAQLDKDLSIECSDTEAK